MIRECRLNDLREVLEIYNDAILNTTVSYEYEPHTIEDRVAWYEGKKLKKQPLIVYEEDNKVMGFATYGEFRSLPGYRYSIEHSVYVHKDYRKKGIGRKLMEELIKIAEKQEYKTLIGVIDGSNEKSIIMHENMGFEFCGRIKEVGYKFDRWLDVVFYQLNLNGPKTLV